MVAAGDSARHTERVVVLWQPVIISSWLRLIIVPWSLGRLCKD